MKKQISCSRPIRSITDKNQVPGLFDEQPRELLGRGFKYFGNIIGLPATVSYSEDCKYYVTVEIPEHLDRVYNAIINKLLGVEPKVSSTSRSLAEILGVKQ